MRIVAFITEAAPVQRILNHIGEPAEPPRISPARGPPAWDDPPVDAVPDWDALAQPSARVCLRPASAVVAAFRRRHPPRRAAPCTQAPANHPSRPLGPLRDGYLSPALPVGPRAGLATPLPAMLR